MPHSSFFTFLGWVTGILTQQQAVSKTAAICNYSFLWITMFSIFCNQNMINWILRLKSMLVYIFLQRYTKNLNSTIKHMTAIGVFTMYNGPGNIFKVSWINLSEFVSCCDETQNSFHYIRACWFTYFEKLENSLLRCISLPTMPQTS